MAKKSVKKVGRDFAQGELVDKTLAPNMVELVFDESTASYPVFKGYDTGSLFQAGSLPDMSRTTPKREVIFVGIDFTEYEGLETTHDPKSDVEKSAENFWDHVHTKSAELEKLIKEVKSGHKNAFPCVFWSLNLFFFSIFQNWRLLCMFFGDFLPLKNLTNKLKFFTVEDLSNGFFSHA